MAQTICSFGSLLILLCVYYSFAINDITDFCVNKCVQHPDIQARWHCLRICEDSWRDVVRNDIISRHGLSSSSRRRRRSIDEEFVPEWVGTGGSSEDIQPRTFAGNGKEGALSEAPQGTLLSVMNLPYENFDNSLMVSGMKRQSQRVNNKPSFARIGRAFWQVPENEKRAPPRSFVRVGKMIPLDEQEQDAFIFDPTFDEGQIDYLTSDKRTNVGSYFRIGRSNPLAGSNEKQNGFDAEPAYYDDSKFAEKRKAAAKSFVRVGRDPEAPAPKYTDSRGRTLGSRSFVRIGKNIDEKFGAVNVVENKEPVSAVRREKRDALSAVAKETSA